MMIQKKRILAAALSAALMAGTLAGCGASAAGNDEAADGEKIQIQYCTSTVKTRRRRGAGVHRHVQRQPG